MWALARGLHLEVPWIVLSAATAVAALTVLLPITFQGVGTRELIFVVALHPFGIAPEAAVLLALLVVTVNLGTTIAVGMFGLGARQ